MFQSSSTSTQSSRSLEQEGTDKYLEISEGDRVQHSLKEKIQKEYYPRIRMVLKSELNSPTKLGVPVLPPAEDGANNSYARRTKAKGKTPGLPTAQVQMGIKSAPRQIPTTGETG